MIVGELNKEMEEKKQIQNEETPAETAPVVEELPATEEPPKVEE